MARAKMGGSHGWNGNYVESATASFSLAPGDSGKTFVLKDASITVTLPTLSDINGGYQVTLISGDDSEHVLSGGASKIYAITINTSASTRVAAASTLTLSAGEIGDIMKIISDGTNWYVQCFSGASAA